MLKEYCAPIPEENEDVLEAVVSPQNTTIVMVNNGQGNGQLSERPNGDTDEKPLETPALGSEPVSPLSGV